MTPARAEQGAAADAAPHRSAPIGPRIIGVLLLAVGLYLLVSAVLATSDGGHALDGPRLAPIVVTAGWVAIAGTYLVRQLVAPFADDPSAIDEPAAADEPTAGEALDGVDSVGDPRRGARWSTPLLLVVALVGYAFALKYTVLGYVIATTVFFVIAARLLSTRPIRQVVVRDVVVAVGLSLAIYLAFTRLLDISLPQGVFPL